MFELTYCDASACDIPVIFGFCKELVDAYEDVESIDYDRVMTWVEKKIRENISMYTRVCHNGKTVAYYHLEKQEAEWEIDDFYVLPEYRGRGIGTEIMEHCISLTDSSVFLYVFLKNTGAIRFYQRNGFVKDVLVGNTRMIMRRKG